MVSLKDIAAECKVSVATVSKALNGYSDISEETRKIISDKAAQMGYLPNMAAITLKTNRTYNIGVLYEDESNSGLTHEYFARVLQAFKTQAEQMGYCITFITNKIGNRRITYSEYCRNRQFDGALIACVDFDKPQVIELAGSGIPVVTIDHIFDNTISIMSDNVKGIRDLMDYLYSMGQRRIAFIHGADSSVTRERVTSFYQCVERLGLDIPPEYVMECRYRDTARAAKCTKKLLELKNAPTCIMYPDDYSAIGGMNMIKSKGLRIPEDISITGYDGTSYGQIHEPSITTLGQDMDRMGKEAAAHLIELIERPKTTLRSNYIIEGSVLVGKSVKQLHGASQQ